MINDQLSPIERSYLLNEIGFNIKKPKGMIRTNNFIRNGKNKTSLAIDLDNGLVKDFGNSYYDGDFIGFLQKALQKDFKETVQFIESKIGRKMNGLDQAKALYKDTDFTVPKKPVEEKEKPKKFWNDEYIEGAKKCINVLEKRGIPEPMEYISSYDGIDIDTLKEYKCGLYGFKDFEFGNSGHEYNNNIYFSFPYETGCMLYRRNKDGEKEILHIKGSQSKHSFFGVGQSGKESSILFLMKSPRECMNFYMFMKGLNVNIIGLAMGEEMKEISINQENQLKKLVKKGDSMIYMVMDCDNPNSYETSLVNSQLISNAMEGYSIVKLMNIHKEFDGKMKDFTDIVKHSIKKKNWKKEKNGFINIGKEMTLKIDQLIQNSEIIL